ncbi:signal transduction histidine kinase [Nakamurella sp. UYEF19]|uniref:sensor histidine kinase n=1 Tax=Nakamurella sp. UYEF19 TaxID=1756392 RepID=UPI0033974B7F
MNRGALIAWSRRHQLPADAFLGLGAAGFTLSAAVYGPIAHHLTVIDLVFALICTALVAFRRRSPMIVFAAVGVLTLVALVLGVTGGATGGALVVAAWTVGVSRPTSVALVSCGALCLALLVRAVVAEGFGGLRAENVNPLILLLLAAAAGTAIRDRRAYLAALVERADRAERTRETEAARRVAEERLRIARDLHDSLAHHMAVVNVQTGVAQHLLLSDPPAAQTALGHARAAAGQVLDELGTVLGVLRHQSDGESTEPAPSLARLVGLIEPLRAGGLDVRWTTAGRPRPLPPAVDQAAYRLVQEALTNVQKHAAGSRVRIGLDYRDGSLVLEIVNTAPDAPRPAPPGVDGFGLAGMRERSAAVGGFLETGPVAGGGYRVFAVLPAPVISRLPDLAAPVEPAPVAVPQTPTPQTTTPPVTS